MSTDTIKLMGVDGADDTPVLATDDFINDIASAARVPAIGSCPVLGTKTVGTVAVGVFDSADVTFTSLSGDQFEYLVLFKDSGTESTSDLIAMWDTMSGLPFTPNGSNASVAVSSSGWYQV